jgi:hypothetical protein
MFSWTEQARLHADLPYKKMAQIVCQRFDEIGLCELDNRDRFIIQARRFSGFAYDAKMAILLEERNQGVYSIEVRYELEPTIAVIVCFLFWPLLLIAWFQGQSAKQRMEREINAILEELEERFARPKKE